MAGFDGAGNYVRPYNWTNDAASNLTISATKFDTDGNTVAAAFNNCLTRDGQGKPTGAIGWTTSLTLTATGDQTLSLVGSLAGPNPYLKLTTKSGQQWGLQAVDSGGGARLYDFTRAASVIDISTTGGVSVAAPSSGTALTISGTANALQFLNAGISQQYARYTNSGADAVFGIDSSVGGSLFSGSAAYSAGFGTLSATSAAIATNNQSRLVVSATGNVTIAAPSSGMALQVLRDTAIASLETSSALYLATAPPGAGAGNAALVLGTDKATGIGYIQSMEPGIGYGSKPLRLQPNGGDIQARGVALVKDKATTASRAGVITPSNDPDLTMTLGVGVFEIECLVVLAADATSSAGGARIGLNHSGTFKSTGGSGTVCAYGSINAAATTQIGTQMGTSPSVAIFSFPTIANGTRTDWLLMKCKLSVSVSGTLAVNWSQNSSTAGAFTLQEGSYLKATQLS